MKIIKRFRLLKHDIYLRIGQRTPVIGLNSQLKKGLSALFWEFDDKDHGEVCASLKDIQNEYDLPDIRIFRASQGNSWHAVCLSACEWSTAVRIVINTDHIDFEYVRLAMQRGHFTLRLTDKGRGEPEVYSILFGHSPEDVALDDFVQIVQYNAWMR